MINPEISPDAGSLPMLGGYSGHKQIVLSAGCSLSRILSGSLLLISPAMVAWSTL
jgi:hypothetical protein